MSLPSLAADPPSPFSVEYHESIGSTNDRARELAAEGAADAVVVADRQTGGRGRRGRSWTGPQGGIYASVVLAPELPTDEVPMLTLAAGVAVARVAREAGTDAWIKWPNDVVVPVTGEEAPGTGDDPTPEGKLAGILTERVDDRAVVGIGVNANVDPADLPDRAVTLRDLVDDVDRGAFVADVLVELDDLRSDPDGILPAWCDLARTLGQRVRVETPEGTVVGEAVGIDRPGRLVVETRDGRVQVSTGDCEHLRPA
ncbi:biotin--[acetyl-CoA-carboxylase] ligase [Halobacteriales archaeon QS_8_69_26]|nr:MAG: biotin--[acetyl-CoA-carboxylase] ligase [Halobacteriales archaeon QS_8_69_26]